MRRERASAALRRNRLLEKLVEIADEGVDWVEAKAVADRARYPRRGVGQTLASLEKDGLCESRRFGERPSMRSDPPPLKWRPTAAGRAKAEPLR